MVGHFRLNFNREIVHLDKPMARKHKLSTRHTNFLGNAVQENLKLREQKTNNLVYLERCILHI